MLLRRHGRAETVRRLQRLRRLSLVRAIRHHGQYSVIGFLGFFCVPYGHRGRFHHLLLGQTANHVFRGSQMLHHLCDGPAVRRGLEVPLRVGQPFGGVQHALLSRLQILQRAVLIRRRNFLRLRRGRACQRQYHHHRYCVTSFHACFLSLIVWVKERNRKIGFAVRLLAARRNMSTGQALHDVWQCTSDCAKRPRSAAFYLLLRRERKVCFMPCVRCLLS